jgi:hypothetical protein
MTFSNSICRHTPRFKWDDPDIDPSRTSKDESQFVYVPDDDPIAVSNDITIPGWAHR